jgi:hypothetical protein
VGFFETHEAVEFLEVQKAVGFVEAVWFVEPLALLVRRVTF